MRDAVERTKARRVAIDSLSEFELALAPSYRDDFRESLFRTISALTGLGVTVLMTVDIVQSFTEFGLSPHITEFLADVLVLQRYVELEGKLEKVLAVVKMRTSRHDTTIRRYAIESSGVVVGEPVRGYGGVLTGFPLVREEETVAARGLSRTERRGRASCSAREVPGRGRGESVMGHVGGSAAQAVRARGPGEAARGPRILVVDDDEGGRSGAGEPAARGGIRDRHRNRWRGGARRGHTRAARRRSHGPADATDGRRGAVPAPPPGRSRTFRSSS